MEWGIPTPSILYTFHSFTPYLFIFTFFKLFYFTITLNSYKKMVIDTLDDTEHTIYVWLDALTNYLTCVDYPDGKIAIIYI